MCLPHVKGLRSKDLVEFVITYCNGESYLPDDYVDYTPNRSWLANLCNSLQNDKFQTLITKRLREREEHLLNSQNLTMEVDKEFAGIFQEIRIVSVQEGHSHHLPRKAFLKKDRDLKEKEDFKNKSLLESIPSLHDQIEDQKEQLFRKEEEMKRFEEDTQILKDLHRQGDIDDNENPILNY